MIDIETAKKLAILVASKTNDTEDATTIAAQVLNDYVTAFNYFDNYNRKNSPNLRPHKSPMETEV